MSFLSFDELEDYSRQILRNFGKLEDLSIEALTALGIPSNRIPEVIRHINRDVKIKLDVLPLNQILELDYNTRHILPLLKEEATQLDQVAEILNCGALEAKRAVGFVKTVLQNPIQWKELPGRQRNRLNELIPRILRARQDKDSLLDIAIASDTGIWTTKASLAYYEGLKDVSMNIPPPERNNISQIAYSRIRPLLSRIQTNSLEEFIIAADLPLTHTLKALNFLKARNRFRSEQIERSLEKETPRGQYADVGSAEACFHCGHLLKKSEKVCPACQKKVMICLICRRRLYYGATVETCPQCKHIFHSSHLREWLKIKGICPICKTHIRLPPRSVL